MDLGRSPLALGATIHQFSVQLSHVDREVYESIDLRVARHPSESEAFLCARVLSFCLEHREGLAFSKGLADPDQPALEVRDRTGAMRAWIEIGAPDAARLHRAAKAAPRVAVYTHHDAERYWGSLAGKRIHRAESLELSVTNGVLYLTIGEELISGVLTTHRLAG